jgi:hypothetical protein
MTMSEDEWQLIEDGLESVMTWKYKGKEYRHDKHADGTTSVYRRRL